jgi:hypothetical protein
LTFLYRAFFEFEAALLLVKGFFFLGVAFLLAADFFIAAFFVTGFFFTADFLMVGMAGSYDGFFGKLHSFGSVNSISYSSVNLKIIPHSVDNY